MTFNIVCAKLALSAREVVKTSTQKDIYKSSRLFYIISAALEYFISILTGSAYLAKLAGYSGIPDGTVGVLTSFISLGCAFQIVSLAMRTDRSVKRMVILMNLANQLCFSFLYVIPVINLPSGAKTAVFIILLLIGNILLNIPFSPKVTWSRMLIDDNKRGAFSAKCEITSLVSGMLFTMIMGRVIDDMETKGRAADAFIVCGITLFVLTALHALCLIMMKEKAPEKDNDYTPLIKRLKDAIGDRNTLVLIPVFVLWNIALYITTPFFGTYQINELGFSMTAVSVITVACSLVRSIVSAPLGALGDKRSFVVSTTLSLSAMAIGLVINSFGGAVCHIIYYILYAVTLAGMNSGQMNLIFDYVEPKRRRGAIAILYTIGGLVGFFATLAAKPLVDKIQSDGNKFLFIENIYAQQVLSIIGSVLVVITAIYINFRVKKLTRVTTNAQNT